MREKRDTAIAQTEHFGSAARAIVIRNLHGFTFAEMITATVRPKLSDLVLELWKFAGANQQVETRGEIIARIAVTDVERVFAMLRPFRRDTKFTTHTF